MKYHWVKRGAYTGSCCGFKRERKTMELPKECTGSLDEAIDEFFRNSVCDCPGAEFDTTAHQDLARIIRSSATRFIRVPIKESV